MVTTTLNDDVIGAWMTDDQAAAFGLTSLPRMGDGASSVLNARVDRLHVPLASGDKAGFDLASTVVTLYAASEPFTLALEGVEGMQRFTVHELQASVVSDDVTEVVAINARLNGLVDDREPTALDIKIGFNEPVTPAGAIALDVAKLTGEVTAVRVPTAPLQTLFADTPIVLARDVGATFDATATFSTRTSPTIAVTATGANLNAELDAEVAADGAVRGNKLSVHATLNRKLVQGYYGSGIRLPRRLTLELNDFSLPTASKNGRDLRQVAANGRLKLEGELLRVPPRDDVAAVAPISQDAAPRESAPLEFRSLDLAFASDALGAGLKLTGSAGVADATVEFDHTIVDPVR